MSEEVIIRVEIDDFVFVGKTRMEHLELLITKPLAVGGKKSLPCWHLKANGYEILTDDCLEDL